MKNSILILSLFTSFYISAQAYNDGFNNHELRFNMGRFLSSAVVEGAYEYYFTPDTSIGGTMYMNANPLGRTGNFGIGPNLRAYFGLQPKSGFFAEVFGLYYTGQTDLELNLGDINYDYSNLAIGLGIGKKWSTFGQKLSMEVYAGIGRNMKEQEFESPFIYRSGLSLGFRF